MKSMGLQKPQFLNSLMNFEKFESAIQAYIQKSNFLSFSSIGKNCKVQLEQYSKIPYSLSNGKTSEVQPKTNTQKIPILNLWMNSNFFCPNLSFTVESKICNLHKISLLTFQTNI